MKLKVRKSELMIKKAVIRKVNSKVAKGFPIYLLRVNRRRYYELKKIGVIGTKIKTSEGEEFYVRIRVVSPDTKEEDFLDKRYIDINFELLRIGKSAELLFSKKDISARMVTPLGTRKM